MKKGKNIPVESVLNHNPFQNLPPLKCKNNNQKLLAAAIKNKDVVMCTGPAGCGKTHVALLQALLLLSKEPDNYDKIVDVVKEAPAEQYRESLLMKWLDAY